MMQSGKLRQPRIAATAASPAARWRDLGMLPLYGLVVTAAATLASRADFGAWPLLIVLACPLLHLAIRRE